MILFSFGSKILAFFREVLIATKFGLNSETDAFFVALTAIGFFTAFITSSIKTTMVPVLMNVESNKGKLEKIYHTNNILNIVLIFSPVIILFGWFLAPYIIRIIAYGFHGSQFILAVELLRLGIPVVLFAGVVGVFRGFLQSESRFFETAADQLPLNLINIIYLFFGASFFGVKGLMIASLFAATSQILLQMVTLRTTKYKYKFVLNFRDEYIKKNFAMVPPVLIGLAFDDINKIIDRSLASTLIEGSISALNYATKINYLILGVFISAISTLVFPTLSKKANIDNLNPFKDVVRAGINIVLLITIPAAVGMMILSEPIVQVVLERGHFDKYATHMTAGAVVFYSIGLVGTSLIIFLQKVFFSLQDSKTPMIGSIIGVIINICLNFILIGSLGHRGLALATSIASIITSIYLLSMLKSKIGSYKHKFIIICLVKTVCASLIMGGIVYITYYIIFPLFNININIMLFITFVVGLIIYSILITIMNIDEVDTIFKNIKTKIGIRW